MDEMLREIFEIFQKYYEKFTYYYSEEVKMKILIPLEEKVKAFIKKHPKSDLAMLTNVLGIRSAVELIQNEKRLFGRYVYFPKLSSLERAVLPEFLKRSFKGLRRNSPVFKKKLKEMSEIFEISQAGLRRILETGRYESRWKK